jgi:uncharacterized iron-regulated membrane protein
MRRVVFQVHLWLGIVAGLYICVVCVTGAALVFRIDMQRARHPHLFSPSVRGPLADPVVVMEHVNRAYPNHRLSGVEAPTSRRPTYLAYVTRGRDFTTVLIDPVTAAILGELPSDALIQSIQRLHFDLMGGRTGRTLNGIGAGAMLVMCATGLAVWWPPRRRPFIWQLHRVVGLCAAGFLALAGITGLSLVFPSAFRAAVNSISPITVNRAPLSSAAPVDGKRPAWSEVIARAKRARPGEQVARVVLPFNDRAALLVMFSTGSPTPAGSELSSVYVDQFTGDLLDDQPRSARTAGDTIMAWTTPLHVGGFGIAPVRWMWFLFGVAPTLLFVTGTTMWWTRVVRPRMLS